MGKLRWASGNATEAMGSKQSDNSPRYRQAVSPSSGDQPTVAEQEGAALQPLAEPTPANRDTEAISVIGIGLRLPRQRPRGTVERFGSRPENWRGLYYVYVIEKGVEKRVQRRPVLGPTASMTKRAAQDKLVEIIDRELALPPELPRKVTFRDLWERYRSLKSGIWSRANEGPLQSMFKKHVLPAIGIGNCRT